jgi:DNA-binding transcriptional ArsR family regulator
VVAYVDTGLQALGDPTRRAIFELLAARARPVGELAAELPVSRPAVSQHLAILRAAHLVTDRRDGVRRIYSIDPEGVAGMRDYFDRFWNQALADFKQAAEETKENDQ